MDAILLNKIFSSGATFRSAEVLLYGLVRRSSVNMGTFHSQKSEWLQIWYTCTSGQSLVKFFIVITVTYFLRFLGQPCCLTTSLWHCKTGHYWCIDWIVWRYVMDGGLTFELPICNHGKKITDLFISEIGIILTYFQGSFIYHALLNIYYCPMMTCKQRSFKWAKTNLDSNFSVANMKRLGTQIIM